MLYNENKLQGNFAKFPLTLHGTEERTFDSLDELIDGVFDEYEKKIELTKGNKKITVKVTDALWAFGIVDNDGIGDTMVVADFRMIDILKKYDFFQADPSKMNNSYWFDAVSLLNKMKPRLF